MSTITLQDPLDALLTEATNGTSLLKDRNTLHFTHIPTLIHHRDIEQKPRLFRFRKLYLKCV